MEVLIGPMDLREWPMSFPQIPMKPSARYAAATEAWDRLMILSYINKESRLEKKMMN